MKNIKWVTGEEGNIIEGLVDGRLTFLIEGTLCVTDLRPTFKNIGWKSPNHYPIFDREDGKRIAFELLNDIDKEKYEAILEEEARRSQETIDLIQSADAFLKSVQEGTIVSSTQKRILELEEEQRDLEKKLPKMIILKGKYSYEAGYITGQIWGLEKEIVYLQGK